MDFFGHLTTPFRIRCYLPYFYIIFSHEIECLHAGFIRLLLSCHSSTPYCTLLAVANSLPLVPLQLIPRKPLKINQNNVFYWWLQGWLQSSTVSLLSVTLKYLALDEASVWLGSLHYVKNEKDYNFSSISWQILGQYIDTQGKSTSVNRVIDICKIVNI